MLHKKPKIPVLRQSISWLQKYVNPRNFSLAFTSIVALSLAAVRPAQAGPWGFSNVTINGIALDTNGGGLTNPTITSPTGLFNIQLEAYNSINTPAIPNTNQILDIFTGKFFRKSDSTVAAPSDFALFYNGQGTVNNRQVFNYTFALDSPGIFDGTLVGNFPNSKIDYDFPPGNGIFDAEKRGFNFTLIVPSTATASLFSAFSEESPQFLSLAQSGQLLAFGTMTPIPFRSSITGGLLIVGAWGAVYKMKKQRSSNKKSNN